MMSNLEHCLEILKALHIVAVSYCLSSGSDDRTVDLDHVLYADDKSGPLPTVTLAVTNAGEIVRLDERLENILSANSIFAATTITPDSIKSRSGTASAARSQTGQVTTIVNARPPAIYWPR